MSINFKECTWNATIPLRIFIDIEQQSSYNNSQSKRNSTTQSLFEQYPILVESLNFTSLYMPYLGQCSTNILSISIIFLVKKIKKWA